MSPIIPSRYGHPKYNIFPQKSRATSLGGFKGSSQRGTPGTDSKSRRKQRLEENKITVQPTEDEEADNFYSKHLATARFQRNHRLINILFSEVVVDHEQTADNEKLQASRQKRIKSLEEYQSKISKEIGEIEEKFAIKKQKTIDDGRKFSEKLNEFITNSKKEIESVRAAQILRRQKEAALRQQELANNPPSETIPSQPISSEQNQKIQEPAAHLEDPSKKFNTLELNQENSSDIRPDSSQETGQLPMEVDELATVNCIDSEQIQKVLDKILESVIEMT